MQITEIELSNWLTHHHLTAAFAPLSVVAGPNGAGKSSVGDAISFAMLADLRRITAKGDRPKLITEGQTKGSVTLRCGDVSITRNVADGKLKSAHALPLGETAVKSAVPYLLSPHIIPELGADAMRTLLLQVMRVDLSAPGLRKTLAERGHAEEMLKELPDDKPVSDWQKQCERSASEARGAWRAITGETYGAVKAEDWQATRPEGAFDDAAAKQAADDLLAARRSEEDAQRTIGAIDQAEASQRSMEQRIAQLRAAAREESGLPSRIAEAERTVATEEAAVEKAATTFDDVQSRMPAAGRLECPHCQGLVLLQGKALAPYEAPKKPASVADHANAHSALSNARSKLDLAKNTLAHLRQKLTEAIAAKEQVAAWEETARTAAPADRDEAQRALADAQANIQSLQDKLALILRQKAEAERAEKATREAAKHHADAKAWAALAEALSPSGVPAELLRKGMGTFNDTLRWMADLTGWRQVAIDDAMGITADGRPYGLLSESEQWRVIAHLAVAIAMHSDCRFVVLDRLDVLEPAHRRTALVWLYQLTKDEDLDTAIAIGTMVNPPEVPSDVSVIWLGDTREEARAA